MAAGVFLLAGCDSAGPSASTNSSDSDSDTSSTQSESFRPFEAGLTGVAGSASSIADVNGDGQQDLLVVGEDTSEAPSSTLYLGNGNGSFSTASATLTGVKIYSSTSIADVDGDGNKDLLITGEDERNLPVAKLYLGNGDGTFSDANANLEGGEGGSSSIADLNGDGHLDLLITGRDKNQLVRSRLYLGNGDGTFSRANADLKGVDFGSHSIADVNQDGNTDILLTGYDGSDPLANLYLGNDDGTFSKANAELIAVQSSSTSIADVNNDGHPDLLITGLDASDNATATLYLGNGDGTFSVVDAGLTGVIFGSTSIADVDADGNQDLLITGEDANRTTITALYLGNGDGGFSEMDVDLTGVEYGSVSIADVDQDQDLDLLLTGDTASEDEEVTPRSILYENVNP